MATLTQISLKDGGQSGAVICTATKADSAINHSLIKLLEGVQWKVQDPSGYLQKKVAINAKISRPEGDKSFAKTMYINKMSVAQGTVVLGEKPAA
jgi:hypothetical protein